MSVQFARSFLAWSTGVNYVILMMWFLVFMFAHDWMRGMHGRWFRLSDEQFGAACCVVDFGMTLARVPLAAWPTRFEEPGVPVALNSLACAAGFNRGVR